MTANTQIPMSREELAEHADEFRLPYSADSMRAPLRELGIDPLETRAVKGTKTSRLAYYDPLVLWVLTLAYHRPKSWPTKAKRLHGMLDEFRERAETIPFAALEAGPPFVESPEWLWRRVSYWRLLVDPEEGLEIRLLDAIARTPGTLDFDMSGQGVLCALLDEYRTELIASFGGKIGGTNVVCDAWGLIDRVLTERGLVSSQGVAPTNANQVVQIVRIV